MLLLLLLLFPLLVVDLWMSGYFCLWTPPVYISFGTDILMHFSVVPSAPVEPLEMLWSPFVCVGWAHLCDQSGADNCHRAELQLSPSLAWCVQSLHKSGAAQPLSRGDSVHKQWCVFPLICCHKYPFARARASPWLDHTDSPDGLTLQR